MMSRAVLMTAARSRFSSTVEIWFSKATDYVRAMSIIASWTLSIRTIIFFGCLCLTSITVLVGILSQNAQSQLSNTALGIYDNAFIPMNYLRSAHSIVLSVSRDIAVGEKNRAVFIDQLQSASDALDVARERAMSPRGESYAKQLQLAVSELQTELKSEVEFPDRQKFLVVEHAFDTAVDTYARDGLRLRQSVEFLVSKIDLDTYIAIFGSVVAAFTITLVLSRAIVPSIRHAVKIASAIAAGALDSHIDRRGPRETRVLLEALAAMQGSIGEKIVCIETLMARQASNHAAEVSSQHARFKAALNNMTLGLCMFDADDNLLVCNLRVVEMFAAELPDADIVDVLSRLDLFGTQRSTGPDSSSRSFNRRLDDGRMIAVSEEAMDDGGRLITYEDITERQRTEARLSHMARHDALTGLPNRLLFREQVECGIGQLRQGGILSLLCLDLDRFKTVNDTLGHPVGDALLRDAAARLLQTTTGADLVVRLGGDEFAVIQYAAQRTEEAQSLAERLIQVLSLPFEIDGQSICVGVSIGIAETMDALDTPDSLLKNADVALYLAKSEGRGTYRFFKREMEEQIQAKRRLEMDLRAALQEQQFELYYQPLLCTRGGGVVAFEALVRWHHPKRGLVSPTEFIPLAEETGLIPELGLWVLNQACTDAMDWPGDVKVAINLSPLQFRCASLVDDVAAALRRSGLTAGRLELEITESLMLHDTDATLTILHDLRGLGICFSMDDFGTGYSSLSYLRRFPFDKIKIDRSFINNMQEGSDGLAIVRAVIGLGQSLRIRVVAEGVETNEQMDLLRTAGCQEVQGYLFSRPQPKAATRQLIERFASR